MSDWLRHMLGLPCRQRVAGHAFTSLSWSRACGWLTHPQADCCMLPARCHAGKAPAPAATGAVMSAGETTAVRLLEQALHLRMNGERAPGGAETWGDWDKRAERLLRALPSRPAPGAPVE